MTNINDINEVHAAYEIVNALINDELLIERAGQVYGLTSNDPDDERYNNFRGALVRAAAVLGHKVLMLDEQKTELDGLLMADFKPNAGQVEPEPVQVAAVVQDPAPVDRPVLKPAEPVPVAVAVSTNDILNEVQAADWPAAPEPGQVYAITPDGLIPIDDAPAEYQEAAPRTRPEPVQDVQEAPAPQYVDAPPVGSIEFDIDELYNMLRDHKTGYKITFKKVNGDIVERNITMDPGADHYSGERKSRPGTLIYWDVDKMKRGQAYIENIIAFEPRV